MRLEAGLKAATPHAVIFGEGAQRLPNTTLFAVPGVKAETAMIAFDLNGIAVSSGSACSSGKVQASHVLAAMGVRRILRAARCASALAGARPQPTSNGSLELGISLRNHYLMNGETRHRGLSRGRR